MREGGGWLCRLWPSACSEQLSEDEHTVFCGAFKCHGDTTVINLPMGDGVTVGIRQAWPDVNATPSEWAETGVPVETMTTRRAAGNREVRCVYLVCV